MEVNELGNAHFLDELWICDNNRWSFSELYDEDSTEILGPIRVLNWRSIDPQSRQVAQKDGTTRRGRQMPEAESILYEERFEQYLYKSGTLRECWSISGKDVDVPIQLR